MLSVLLTVNPRAAPAATDACAVTDGDVTHAVSPCTRDAARGDAGVEQETAQTAPLNVVTRVPTAPHAHRAAEIAELRANLIERGDDRIREKIDLFTGQLTHQLAPSDPGWNDRSPRWAAVLRELREDVAAALIAPLQAQQECYRELWERELDAQLSPAELRKLLQYFHSARGQRYVALQRELDSIILRQGEAFLGAHFLAAPFAPFSGQPPAPSVVEDRVHVLALSLGTLFSVREAPSAAQSDADRLARSTQASQLSMAAWDEGPALDVLRRRYAVDLPAFAEFHRSVLFHKLRRVADSVALKAKASADTTTAIEALQNRLAGWRARYGAIIAAGDPSAPHRSAEPVQLDPRVQRQWWQAIEAARVAALEVTDGPIEVRYFEVTVQFTLDGVSRSVRCDWSCRKTGEELSTTPGWRTYAHPLVRRIAGDRAIVFVPPADCDIEDGTAYIPVLALFPDVKDPTTIDVPFAFTAAALLADPRHPSAIVHRLARAPAPQPHERIEDTLEAPLDENSFDYKAIVGEIIPESTWRTLLDDSTVAALERTRSVTTSLTLAQQGYFPRRAFPPTPREPHTIPPSASPPTPPGAYAPRDRDGVWVIDNQDGTTFLVRYSSTAALPSLEGPKMSRLPRVEFKGIATDEILPEFYDPATKNLVSFNIEYLRIPSMERVAHSPNAAPQRK